MDTLDGQGFVSDIEIVRGELVSVLCDHIRDKVEYIFGDSITAVNDNGDQVHVSFANSDARDFDLLLLADGLTSKTHALVFGNNESYIHHLNQYTAYFTIPHHSTDSAWSRWYNAPGGRNIFLRPDGKDTRVFLSVIRTPNGLEKLSVQEQKAEMHKVFADAGWEAPRVLSAMEKAGDFFLQENAQVKMDSWSKGRVALVGDAGYCPSRISGMGTSVAIVGAYILAGEIATHDNHTDAFAAYEKVMRPYVTKAQVRNSCL